MTIANPNHLLRRAGYLLCLIGAYSSLAVLPNSCAADYRLDCGNGHDQSGAVVATATVKATSLATGFSRSAQTNGLGEYRIDYLPVGTYTVDVGAKSFKHFTQKNLDLTVDQTLTLMVSLSVVQRPRR